MPAEPPVRDPRPGAAALAGIAFGGATGTVATAAAAGDAAAGWERDVARTLYDLPGWATPLLSTVMQAGTRLAIVVAALALLLLRQRRAAVAVALGAATAWAVAMVLKDLVARPRPAAGVLGGTARAVVEGPGFPSSHAAIAAAVAVALGSSRRERSALPALAAVAVATGIARVHLGVHWPLDVVGGGAVGAACGALAALGCAACLGGSGDVRPQRAGPCGPAGRRGKCQQSRPRTEGRP